MKTKTAVLNGKSVAGNPYVQFDEGEVASKKTMRGSLLYKIARNRLEMVFAVVAMTLVSSMATAEEVSKTQAQLAVQNWVRKNPRVMNLRFRSNSGKVETMSDDMGRTLCHVVNLDGGGFVVTSGDTRLSPVIAFSDSGEFSQNSRSPLYVLLKRDMPARLGVIGDATDDNSATRKLLSAVVSTGSASTVQSKTKNEKAWDELLSEPKPVLKAVASSSQLDDVRVEPMIKTEWDQSTWGNFDNTPMTYNLDTPQHMVCGCVATAASQIMNYWQYPKNSVPTKRYKFYVNGVEGWATVGGDAFDWANMPVAYRLTPTISEVQRKAVARLTHEIGVASNMSYTDTKNGSGTWALVTIQALRDHYGYASAMGLEKPHYYGEAVDDEIRNALLASLDAGMPCTFGMSGTEGGHEVVADGYGLRGLRVYIHLNCGWSGNENFWYDLFGERITNSYGFEIVDEFGYNIHPTESGDVVSGRVLDASGKPVQGASVTMTDAKNAVVSTMSNAKGIYFFRVKAIGRYSIQATASLKTSKPSAVEFTSLSRSTKVIGDHGGVEFVNNDYGYSANKWGVDLTLEDAAAVGPEPESEPVAAPVFQPAEGSFTASSISVSISCGTYGATIRYTKDGSEPTANSPVYSSAIKITATTTFKARAFKNGMADSDVTTKTYTKVVVKPTITPKEAIDWSGTVTVSDTSLVSGQDTNTHDGSDALSLSLVNGATSASASIEVSGPGMLSFWWAGGKVVTQTSLPDGKVSEVPYFRCQVDGSNVASRGMTDWRKVDVPIAAGTHTVKWEVYSAFVVKDSNGYLDEVSFTPYAGGTRTIRFDANGAEDGELEKTQTTGAYTDKIALPGPGTLVREGYVIAGWVRDPSAIRVDYGVGSAYMIGMKDETLYACWHRVVDVLVEFPQAGGEQQVRIDGYGTSFETDLQFPDWARNFYLLGRGQFDPLHSLGNGRANVAISAAELYLKFSAEPNDAEADRAFDLDLISHDYPLVVRYHVVQKGDVVSDKLKALLAEGADSVAAGQQIQLTGRAIRRNGQVEAISPTWEIVSGSGNASLSTGGLLTAGKTTTAKLVTVRATYSDGGIVRMAEKAVTVLPTCDLNTALDNTSNTFEATGWIGQVGEASVGGSAAKSPSCYAGTSVLRTTVIGPHKVSFDCRVTSDIGGGKLVFVDNGKTNFCACAVPMSIDGWTQRTFYLLGEGAHQLEWVYLGETGGTAAAQNDAAWLDGLSIEEVQGGVCTCSFAKKGWHRVSFNALPDNPSPASVFAAVKNQIASVSECGGSAYWTPTGGDLTTLSIGKVYWVETQADGVSLIVEGAMQPDAPITLKKGWNCIGYTLPEARSPQVALKTALNGGKITSIALAGGSEFYPYGGLEQMSPGQVFWVEASANAVITYDLQ